MEGFTVKLKNEGEFIVQMIQESLKRSADVLTGDKKLTMQQTVDMQTDIADIHSILSKEGNIEEISVYSGEEKIAVYAGYKNIDSVTKTLQSTSDSKFFVVDIQLSK